MGFLVDRGRAVEIAEGRIESRTRAPLETYDRGCSGIQVLFNGFIRPVMSHALSISRLIAGERVRVALVFESWPATDVISLITWHSFRINTIAAAIRLITTMARCDS